MKKRLSVLTILLATLLMLSIFAPQVKAQATSNTSDPTDDLYYYMSGSPASAWAVIDIVWADISQVDSSNIKLLIRANQAIPLTNQWQGYYWLLDMGIPAPPYWNPIDSNDLTVAYTIGVNWGADGSLHVTVGKYDGTVIFYEDARSHPGQYFSGDTCFITIPLSWIGNPNSIKWVAGSTDGVASPSGRHDKAPNIGHTTLTIGPSVVSSKPRNLVAESRLSNIGLYWTEPEDTGGSAILSYRIYRGTSSGGEVFLSSVDGGITKYDDTSVSETLYFYYVTAVNSFGESLPSDEVKCSSIESLKGIENVVELNHFNTPFYRSFSIQQNFEIAVGGSLSHRYWVQNIIWVRPAFYRLHLPCIQALVEIYQTNDGWLHSEKIVPWYKTITWLPQPFKNKLTLRSSIGDSSLLVKNDFKQFSYQLPSGSYIIVQRIPKISSLDSPEIVIVGTMITPSVSFKPTTDGHVGTYVQIGNNPGAWLLGKNTVLKLGETHTEETSRGLQWFENGNFNYTSGFSDQGLFFRPDYEAPLTLPPIP